MSIFSEISNIFIPEQNQRILDSINYSLKANNGIGESFGINGCARCVCTVLLRAGYNPDIYDQSVSNFIYEMLMPMVSYGGQIIIDNNPDTKGTNLYVDPNNIEEINKRIRPGDIIAWRGGDPNSGNSYRKWQAKSHIGIIYNKVHSNNSWFVAHNEQEYRITKQKNTGIIRANSRLVFGDYQDPNMPYPLSGFMNHPNPIVFRMPPIPVTYLQELEKKFKKSTYYEVNKSIRNKFIFFIPQPIALNKLLTFYNYEYDYGN